MVQRIRTTVMLDSKTTRKVLDTVDDWEADKEAERERLSAIARESNNIQTVEEGTHSLVVIYNHGTVKVFNWVAVPE
jgi:PHD/YefM family antitoxin component YafN of YafNO toxin-antitoxin module